MTQVNRDLNLDFVFDILFTRKKISEAELQTCTEHRMAYPEMLDHLNTWLDLEVITITDDNIIIFTEA